MTMFRFLLAKQSASPAVPNVGFGLIGAGDASMLLYSTEKYTFSDNTVVYGTSLWTGTWGRAACSNGVTGIFGAGDLSRSTDKYTFSNNSVVIGTELNNPTRHALGAAGNATLAVFAGGRNGYNATLGGTSMMDRYVYATNAVTSGVGLSAARYGLVGAGTTEFGLFMGGVLSSTGVNSDVVEKYTYDTNVNTSATSLLSARSLEGSLGNAQLGIISGGTASGLTINRYTYASNSVAAGASLSSSRSTLAGASNSGYGIFAGGNISGTITNKVEKYVISSNVMSSGTNLLQIRQLCSGCSSNPGHL